VKQPELLEMDDVDVFTGDPLDRPVYGATAIGRIINRTPAQVYHSYERGYLDADKFGRILRSTPRRLLKPNQPTDAA
jgi:hypothetical protein